MANSSGSDTESESQSSVDDLNPVDSTFISSTQAICATIQHNKEPSAQSLFSAIQKLKCIDITAVSEDFSLHDDIQHASSALLGFLDILASQNTSSNDDIVSVFCAILEPSFLELLFAYRQIFHAIAARDASTSHHISTVVCWVDVILAKLGNATGVLATHPVIAEENLPSTLQEQRDYDALRAATQLPDKWEAVPNVICADRASPAARRLALRLLFGALVMRPQLHQDSSAQASDFHWPTLARSLVSYLEHLSVPEAREGTFPDANYAVARDLEPKSLSMYLSLSALAELATDDTLHTPFRPATQATLLHLLITIICPTQLSLTHQQLITPTETLSPAQMILIRWGQVLPWCWSVWHDPRVAHSEIVDQLTSTWLYHLGECFYQSEDGSDTDVSTWQEDVVTALGVKPEASAKTVIRLLHYATTSLQAVPPTYLTTSSLDVVYKACWAATILLQERRDLSDVLEANLCSGICKLFASMGQNAHENRIGDVAINALSLVSPDIAKPVLKKLSEDQVLMNRLEEKIASVTKLILKEGTRERIDKEDVCAIRLLLQFCTIIWGYKINMLLRRQTISPFFSGLVNWSKTETAGAERLATLRDPLLTALAMSESLEEDAIDKSWDDETIWEIAINSGSNDLLVAAAFALYISFKAPKQSFNALVQAEAWDYLRDVLLLILTHHYLAIEEPLALLTCPSVCRALVCLLQRGNGKAVRYMLSSPWTINLCATLRDILASNNSTENDYYGYLRTKALKCADEILQAVTVVMQGDGLQNVEFPSLPPLRTISCEILSIPRLIVVSET